MTWIWANARRQRKTEEPGMLQSMGSQTARYYLATEQQAYIHKTNFILYTVLYIYGKLGGGAWHTHTTIKPVSSKGNLNIYWKDWRWSSNALATCREEPTLWKRPWCWERLKARGEGDDRLWDGWMASLTQRTWVWVGSGSWWWTGKPGVLQSMGSQRVGHDWMTELNWNFKHSQPLSVDRKSYLV